ncbi:epoxide hydrolase [Streptomyces sp. NPDC007162]|uniref:epoxide hydrolase family protein n=1 Tax=Streptomyces sp. NPDC007162 TaxID=3156917 RepID=UPI0033E1F599
MENARTLVDYWERGYDWRRFESELNRFPQFLTEIDGLDIHFIHVRSKNPHAMPLLLTHGWPGSIVEFLRLIDPLTDPVAFGGDAADSFDVVIPSLPGFGFSQKPTETGWTVSRIRRRMGGADEASRLPEMGRAGRRLGCRRHHRPRGHAT